MSISDPETGSLREGLETALAGDGGDTVPGSDPTPPAPAAPPVPEFQIPEKWPNPAKEAVKAMLALPDGTGRKWADSWLGHWKEQQGYTTKVEQERAQLRQQWDPIRQAIEPAIQQWQVQGMSPQQGISQLIGVAQYLARDPAGGVKWLAQQYGLDLAKLVEQQGYVAPEVQTIQQELRQLREEQRHWQFQIQQHQRQAVIKSVTEQLKAFESATDASGNPKWPHYDRLQDRMAEFIAKGVETTIEGAYEHALQLDKDLQKDIASKQAQADIEKRAADAKRAQEASRTVRAKGTASTVPDRSMRDELKHNLAAAGISD